MRLAPIALLLVASAVHAQDAVPATPLVPGSPAARPGAAPTAVKPLTVGDRAPAFEIAEWVKGSPVAAFEPGKVYVMEFWATWCGPCRTSMPHLTELQESFKAKGVRVLGISDESREKVSAFLETPEWQEKVRYTIGCDPDRSTHRDYMQATGQRGIPTAFIVDGCGELAWIGHPMLMDAPLARIVAGEWDNVAHRDRHERQQARDAAWRERARTFTLASRGGQWDAALEVLEAQLAEYPEDPSANLSKCRILVLELGRPEEGVAAGRRLAEAPEPDAMVLNQLAWSLLDSGKAEGEVLELARAAAERAVAISQRKDAAMLDNLARALWQSGDKEQAIELQREAVAIAPAGRRGDSIRKGLEQYLEAIGGS